MKKRLFAIGSVLAAPLAAQMTAHDVANAGHGYRVSAALGDVDGDGIEDLVVGNNGRFELCRGTSRQPRRFAAARDLGVEVTPSCESAGEPRLVDVDRDGDLDLLTIDAPNWTNARPVWFANDGKGGFAKAAHFDGAAGAQMTWWGSASAVRLHDWNGDGHVDLLVATPLVVVYFGGPDGFAVAPHPLGPKSRSFEVVDWDADGDADLVTAPAGELLLHQNDDGALRAPVALAKVAADTCPVRLTVGDWNADGREDLLVGDHQRLPKQQVPAAEIAADKARLAAVDRILAAIDDEIEALNAQRPPRRDAAAMQRRVAWREQLERFGKGPRELRQRLLQKQRASVDPGSRGVVRALVR